MHPPRLALALLALTPALSGQNPYATINGDAPDDRFGSSVAGVGDLDGDGVPDFMAAAVRADFAGADSGRVTVFSGADGSVLYRFDGDAAGDQFGTSVREAGDVDGDGVGDLVVGAPFHDGAGADSGAARVFSGRDGSVLHTFVGIAAGDELGSSVASAGDTDGDGHDDVLVGAPGADVAGNDRGYARVFSGRDGSVLTTLFGLFADDRFGAAVSALGDIDGDARADYAVGAPQVFGAGIGYVAVVSGQSGTILQGSAGARAGDNYGIFVDPAGDVDRDGLPDLIVGASQYQFTTATPVGAGYASVRSGSDHSVLHTFSGISTNDWYGIAVAGIGDVDGDGHDDLAVGACQVLQPANAPGYVRVWSGADGSLLHEMGGDRHNDVFGRKLARIGDLNGDGRADLLVGARKNDNNGLDAGMVRVFHLGPLATPHLAGACAEGSAGVGNGGPFRLLTINGDDGWVDRRVVLPRGAPLTIRLDNPPSNPQPATSAILGFVGVPTFAMATNLPLGAGTLCFPPAAIWSVGTGPQVYGFPPLPAAVQLTLQAIVEDAPGQWRVANALIIDGQ